MKKLLKVSAPIAVLLTGVLIVKGLAAARPAPEKVEEENRLVSLYVDEARSDAIQVKVETQGEVRPKTQIDLVPQVSGRIVSLSENFNDGAEFRAGDLLLKIDDTDYRLALANAEAVVARAQTELERQLATKDIKEKEWSNNRKAGEEPTAFSLNLTQVAQAEAELRSARAQLRQARLDLERTELRLPFDGRVRSRDVGIGQFVTAGVSLGTVFSTDIAEVRLPLTDTQLVELDLPMGYTAEDALTAPRVLFSTTLGNREYQWEGRIVRVSAAVDQETRLIYATAEVADPYGAAATDGMPMAVGLFVNARIGGVEELDAIVMPRLALRNEDKVYVINEDNRLEIRTVDVISTSEDQVLVASGVAAGEHVVTSTLPNATDGMEVEPLFRNTQS
ncbi:MAG: efflux RND transporter periplasmic adaptor subunit [Xanthomonadales bacterium]|nr:efflux RND transporter periplasmic adaptor subunit [Xanthomonadales bacterium]